MADDVLRLTMHQSAGLMRGGGRDPTALQRGDGGFHIAWQIDVDAPDTVGRSRFYPGEALWALALLHEAFPGEGWDSHARDALHFITTLRDDVEDVDFPPLADQWTAYGLAEGSEGGTTGQRGDYARKLAGGCGIVVRTASQREGSWYGSRRRGEDARASGVGTWTEGLAGLWRVAAYDDRLADIKDKTEERLHCIAGILADRQFDAEEAEEYDRPGLVEGAWFHEGETRMDDQQHAFSGITYALDALAEHQMREPEETLE